MSDNNVNQPHTYRHLKYPRIQANINHYSQANIDHIKDALDTYKGDKDTAIVLQSAFCNSTVGGCDGICTTTCAGCLFDFTRSVTVQPFFKEWLAEPDNIDNYLNNPKK